MCDTTQIDAIVKRNALLHCKKCFVHVDNFYQTPKLTTMYIICISYPLQS